MATNIIELAGTELVEGLAIAQGSMTFEQLVAKFGLARAQQLWAEYAVDGLYLDFGGSIGSTTAYAGVDAGSLIVGGSPASVSSTTETALELAQSSQLTAADTGIATYTQGALQTGSGTAKASSLLSLDVGIVGAAIAPVLGVALGVELYENNPQFWTLLSQKLLPFCYPGTTEIPAWTDIIESITTPGTYETHTLIDKRIYDALKAWFEEEGWGSGGGYQADVSSLQNPTMLDQPVQKSPLIQEYPIGRIVGIEYDCDFILSFKRKSDGGMATYAYNMTNRQVRYRYYYNDGTTGSWYTYSMSQYYTEITNTPYWRATSPIDSNSAGMVPNMYTSMSGTDIAIRGATVVIDGSEVGGVPEGTELWDGSPAVTTPYEKPIIYMIEDLENPGHFIPEPVDAIEVALPEKSSLPAPEAQSTEPENWPEGVQWPLTLDFPWAPPEGYEGDWPETMPWPLPEEQPDWWPNVIPYPGKMPMPAQSIDPTENPDPNLNVDPVIPTEFISKSLPGISTDPTDDPVPQPEEDPSQPPSRPTTAFDDPTPPAPEPSGETPDPDSTLPTVPLPWTPSASSPDGLITVYHPTDAQLKAFASWLWVTYADPSIDKLWNNPFDGVIGLMELYCTPTDVGTKNIRSGFLDSGVQSQTISRYTEIDCGSITVPEYYGNYLDYSPYSKCHVYLPFIGIVELNVDDIVGHAVNIMYKIDEYNGACIALITVAKSINVAGQDVDYSNTMYQFSGNCAVELPLAGGTQAAIRAGLIQAAAYGLSSVIGGIASGAAGNIGGAVSQIGYGAANAIGSVVSAKSSVQHSGSFGSSYGAMGIKTPYIVVTRPKQIVVPDYEEIYGFPAHKMVTLGTCIGYVRVREINVRSSNASDEEKKRIEELLKEGVYID